MRLYFCGAVILLAGIFAACSSDEVDPNPERVRAAPEDAGRAATPPSAGTLPDEQFPDGLLDPYKGPPIAYYDNSNLSYLQLRSRIKQVFADDGIGGKTDDYLAGKIALLGGADFKTHFTEARSITPDYLLALDGIAKDSCARAAANKTGPFKGGNPDTDAPDALIARLFNAILFHAPSAKDTADFSALYTAIAPPLSVSKTEAWAGVCEALVRHPDSIFTLPPSVATAEGADKERLQLVKLSNDLVGRLPTDEEVTSLAGKSIDDKVDHYLALPEFRDFYLHRVLVRTESVGTVESDEPARLWTYLVTTGGPFQDLFTADYSVDANFAKATRPPEHGKTGLLTMPGFIKTKPGLPHYNYSARVLTDFMGHVFDVPQEILALRDLSTSTTDPKTVCISCHALLTPLETQRLRWADDGTYRTVDDKGLPLDDSDRGLVADYPYKGQGIEAFSSQAVKKERFMRQIYQSQFLFFMGRQMRFDLDERTVYLALWNKTFEKNGDMRALVKVIANVPSYLSGQQ